jgi:hypothetical protein
MSRQIGVVIIGVIVALALIFAIFDERVSFKEPGANSRMTQSQLAPN